jgi:hypothetical protein
MDFAMIQPKLSQYRLIALKGGEGLNRSCPLLVRAEVLVLPWKCAREHDKHDGFRCIPREEGSKRQDTHTERHGAGEINCGD